MTRADGVIPASDTNIVDGLPVYNACVVIKGSYAGSAGAQHYQGQFPKVLVEGHIDVVNPEELPKSGDPSIRIKLQPYAQPVVATPEELAAIPTELSFDARGRVVEDDKYATASKVFANAQEAEAGGGVRIYVPGYGDMMPSTSNAFVLAAAMKKHNIRPVYDIWICGTAGEEGKGNLAGMKQLYGFDQQAGSGSNPLNFVANFGLEGGGIVNFVGSYRFEMKFKAPFARPQRPERTGGNGGGDREDRRGQDADRPAGRRAENHLHGGPRQLRAAAEFGHGRAELLARGGHALDAQGDTRGHPEEHRAGVPGGRVRRKRQARPQGRQR
jgi:acetylornithine deacetylase/succinyl-diaminopimelate desuccinylase-like protein